MFWHHTWVAFLQGLGLSPFAYLGFRFDRRMRRHRNIR